MSEYTKPYHDAVYEMANELHVKRMNELHRFDRNESINFDN